MIVWRCYKKILCSLSLILEQAAVASPPFYAVCVWIPFIDCVTVCVCANGERMATHL